MVQTQVMFRVTKSVKRGGKSWRLGRQQKKGRDTYAVQLNTKGLT
jgi:hypothetical protein